MRMSPVSWDVSYLTKVLCSLACKHKTARKTNRLIAKTLTKKSKNVTKIPESTDNKIHIIV